MQTFLPYSALWQCAACLDSKRLGKQRVEAAQIITTLATGEGAWRNHPAVRMWENYPLMLGWYYTNCVDYWERRGFKNTMPGELKIPFSYTGKHTGSPIPCSIPALLLSHRASLLRKNPTYYSRFPNWQATPALPYYWPVPTAKQEWLPEHDNLVTIYIDHYGDPCAEYCIPLPEGWRITTAQDTTFLPYPLVDFAPKGATLAQVTQ